MLTIGYTNEFSEQAEAVIPERLETYNPNGRTREQHKQDIFIGEVTELAALKHLNLEKSKYSFYDGLSEEGEKYEIKSTRFYSESNKWWNMSTDYSYFKQNCHNINYIVLTTIQEDEVKLLYKADAPSFYKYVCPSNSGNGYYYNQYKAMQNGDCISY